MTLADLLNTLESADMLRIIKGDEEIFVGYLALFAPEVGHTNCKLYEQQRNGKYYKALYDQAGNSIAVPIFESIFRKIILHEVA